ncbi:MAG: hypothetical protein EU548_04425 [Promethearchaeota archaeon]|nr:MAG: hypothetical protein EU548_04425 [Candidatus Lokiarchaeota archaeon]
MIEPDYEFRFFFFKYLKEFFSTPKVAITKKQFESLLFGRLVEITIIGIMWLCSKIPLIGLRMERALAYQLSKKWSFKPLPNPDTLSNEAIQFKQDKEVKINHKFDVQTKILDITTFNEIVEKFPFTSVSECGCRSVIHHCDAPFHTCLTMSWPQEVSGTITDASKYKKATDAELNRVIDLADKHALVHMALNWPDQEHTYVVCNCCDCCCISFREFKAHAVPMIVGSQYVARVDPNKCTGCFYCVNFRCRFRAIDKLNEDGTVIDTRKEDKERISFKWPIWSERRNGWGTRIRKDPLSWKKVRSEHEGKWVAKIDPNRCFGCGNCASPKYGCPEGAIKLYPRDKHKF